MAKDWRDQPIASFDVFDTVLMRAVTDPDSVHLLVGRRLASEHVLSVSPEEYTRIRVLAERSAGPTAAGRAPSLDHIAAYVAQELRLDADTLAQVRACEVAMELELLEPVPGALDLIEGARRDGRLIAYVSDMHLSATDLAIPLRNHGFLTEHDLVLTSSDHAASKANDGELFATLLKRPEVDERRAFHHGNDAWSDIEMARRRGLGAVHLPDANPNRYEQLLESHSTATGGLAAIMAGAGRRARLTESETEDTTGAAKHDEAIRSVATGVAAPVLIGFVLWAMRYCRDRGISRVYFLTRDGVLPLEIAQRLPNKLIDGLELRLLEASRSAIALPSVAAVDYDRWLAAGTHPGGFLIQHNDVLPATALYKRAGVDAVAHREQLESLGLDHPNEPLAGERLRLWIEALASPAIREIILAAADERIEPVLAYLAQEGLTDGSQSAIVDIGWTGQQSSMLSALVKRAGGRSPLHLHIGRMGQRQLLHDTEIDYWLFDERREAVPIDNPVALFEAFCVTLTGSVTGYEVQDEQIVATRRTEHHAAALRSWGQQPLEQSILSVAEHLRVGDGLVDTDGDLRPASVALLQEFWRNPTAEEARVWGEFPYEQDQLGHVVRTLAIPYGTDQLRARRRGEFHGLDWKSGSLALSPAPIRLAVQATDRLRDVAKRRPAGTS